MKIIYYKKTTSSNTHFIENIHLINEYFYKKTNVFTKATKENTLNKYFLKRKTIRFSIQQIMKTYFLLILK